MKYGNSMEVPLKSLSTWTTGKPADVYYSNHQRTHDKVLDMPFLVPTAPIKGVWYLDGSTVGTDNALPTPIMVGTQTVEKEITVDELVVDKDHAWPTQSVAKTTHCT